MTEVYLNSEFVGTVENAAEFINRIKEERRLSIIPNNINAYYNQKSDEVYVDCSKGRARRPLIIVKDGQPLLTEKHIKQLEKNEITWSDLLKQGVISPGAKIDIAVPTGNFGNILAAFYAKKMGLPVNKLICASNANRKHTKSACSWGMGVCANNQAPGEGIIF